MAQLKFKADQTGKVLQQMGGRILDGKAAAGMASRRRHLGWAMGQGHHWVKESLM